MRSILKDYAAPLGNSVRIADAALILLIGIGVFHQLLPQLALGEATQYLAVLSISALLAVLIFPAFQIYRSWRGRQLIELFLRITWGWMSVAVLMIGLTFLANLEEPIDRSWLGVWLLGAWLSLISIRAVIFLILGYLRIGGQNHKQVAIFGAGALGRELARRAHNRPASGYDVIAFFDDEPALEESAGDGIPVCGPRTDIESFVREKEIDEVWIALPLRAEQRVKELLHELRHSTVTICYVPDIFGFRLLNHSTQAVLGMPMIALSETPMVGFNKLIKELEDRLLSVLILTLISPLMLAIAIGVKLSSPGPILFKQSRHGWDGKPITVYKFRTMRKHHEKPGRVTQASLEDPRVTNFGRFLRRTSLDELPQFINVLQGTMSIVGPRPHAIEHNEHYKDQVDQYMQRHRVKPGITGWAQINGYRGETDTLEKMRKRVEHDLFYIENWSIFLDLKIIIKTALKGFRDSNAY